MDDDGVCIYTVLAIRWLTLHNQILGHLRQMLDRKNQSLQDIVKTLRIYHDNVDDEQGSSTTEAAEHSPSQKEILRGLIAALDTSPADI